MGGYRFDKLRILVVDDNQHMRALVSAVLHAAGVKTVFTAPDAEEAWEQLSRNSPDVIFLDWVMDGMSGLDFTKRVRTTADSPNPFVPIIMVTGYSSPERVIAARDAGVNEFLAKPISAKAILSRLVAIIERPRPFVRTKAYFGPCRRRRNSAEYGGPDRRATNETVANDDNPAHAHAS